MNALILAAALLGCDGYAVREDVVLLQRAPVRYFYTSPLRLRQEVVVQRQVIRKQRAPVQLLRRRNVVVERQVLRQRGY